MKSVEFDPIIKNMVNRGKSDYLKIAKKRLKEEYIESQEDIDELQVKLAKSVDQDSEKFSIVDRRLYGASKYREAIALAISIIDDLIDERDADEFATNYGKIKGEMK